jgi:gamma-butyrobetaine dioxygenase
LVFANAKRRIVSLFHRFGSGKYTIGEEMTITQHSAQAAALARLSGEDPSVVAAALLHDVGHLLGFEAGLEAEMDGCT